MCGIAGRFHPDALPDAHLWGERASQLLAHRGPDDQGRFLDSHCELVARRLAIVDLSPSGRQPMTNEDHSIYVVYNGEIYNHGPLRQDLIARGHVFRGHSDTEVLIHLYEEYGERLVDHLRGMFAFAIYDQRRCQVLLARDRFGIKPLYYAEVAGHLIFASEMKAILAMPGFAVTLDRQACYDYIGLVYVPEPATTFQQIRALSKGSLLIAGRDGIRQHRYYQVEARPAAGSTLQEQAEIVADRLVDAVQSQSIADVPVGALLSGGLDSSLVVAAYSQTVGVQPVTFNVRFPDQRYDETPLALEVARRFHTTHHIIDVSADDLKPELVLDLLRHFDQPFADTSLIPTYLVARAIRERGIICALSGDGGDEAFGGYESFWKLNRLVQLMTLPAWTHYPALLAGALLSPYTRDLGRRLRRAVQLARMARKDAAIVLKGLNSYLSENQISELLQAGAAENLEPVHRHFAARPPCHTADLGELSRRLTETSFDLGLTSDMLRKVDMMSMRASVEVRVPMLDESLVAQAMTLPHHLKTDGRQCKLVLRQLARQRLPPNVASHRKQGFTIPLDVMVGPAFHDMLADYLLGSQTRIHTLVKPNTVRIWVDTFRQARGQSRYPEISREGLFQRVVMLLALELWMRDYGLNW